MTEAPKSAVLRAADQVKIAGDALAQARILLRNGTMTAIRQELIREATRLRTAVRDLETSTRLHAAQTGKTSK